jgi:uncharacterized cupredoxin-like copper-binding protein
VTVALGKPQEFSLVPSVPSVAAGKVTFTVTNSGQVLHEMVVVPAPGGSQSLKQPDGTASEDGTLGEAPDVEVGKTTTFTVTMKPGKYSLLCNLPGTGRADRAAGLRVARTDVRDRWGRDG